MADRRPAQPRHHHRHDHQRDPRAGGRRRRHHGRALPRSPHVRRRRSRPGQRRGEAAVAVRGQPPAGRRSRCLRGRDPLLPAPGRRHARAHPVVLLRRHRERHERVRHGDGRPLRAHHGLPDRGHDAGPDRGGARCSDRPARGLVGPGRHAGDGLGPERRPRPHRRAGRHVAGPVGDVRVQVRRHPPGRRARRPASRSRATTGR